MKLAEIYKRIGADKPLFGFPSPLSAECDGLVCFGADLEPETIVHAYSLGIFPWSFNPITWWSPNPRAIFEIETFTLRKRMLRYLKSAKLKFSFDKAFASVIEGCARSHSEHGLCWITPAFIRAYTRLYELGVAHSIEAWLGETLVGGVYGVALGGFFAGESMFSTVSNASTLALYRLITHLRQRGFVLFDSQAINNHTRFLGAIEIDVKDYLTRLKKAIRLDCNF